MVEHLTSHGLLSDKQYVSRPSAGVLTVIAERVYQALNKNGDAQAIALHISKTLDGICHIGLLHKLNVYGISGRIFELIQSFLSNPEMKIYLERHSFRSFCVNANVLQC